MEQRPIRPAEPADAGAQLAAEERSETVLGTAEDVLARIPFALGFHPEQSLVALAIDADDRAGLVLRMDLPPPDPAPPDPDRPELDPADGYVEYAEYLVAALRQDNAVRTLVVVYSATDPAPGFVDAIDRMLAAHGVRLVDVLRADEGRWWSLLCPDPRCCPPEGRPYELATHPLTVRSVYRGEVALPDEQELRASVAPLLGLTRLSMTQATARVEAAVERRYAGLTDTDRLVATFERDGIRYVRRLLARYVDVQLDGTADAGADPRVESGRPTDDEVAWASVYVATLPVRDDAWLTIQRSTADRHVWFWREVARRAVPPYDVAPTALLAFSGWLAGDGPLARCALERVLATDPDYTMAHLLRSALVRMVPPSVWAACAERAARIADSPGWDNSDENPEAEGGTAA